MVKLKNHSIECLRDVYDSVVGDEYQYGENEVVVCYEMNITVNQEKQSWSKAEQTSLKRVMDILDESEPLGYMLFTEHQANGWIHFHGLVWFRMFMNSVKFLNKKLNRRIGNTLIQQLRDGKIEHPNRKYVDWFDYMSKDYEKEGNSVLSSDYFCDCGSVEVFFRRGKIETEDVFDTSE